MITVKDQEARAVEFVHSIGQGGLDAGCFAADMTAWSPISGFMTSDIYLPKLPVVKAIFAQRPLTMTIDGTTSQRGRTIVQCRGEGALFNGAVYTNSYLILVEFNHAGQIRHVREYMDSARALNILVPAMKEWLCAQEAREQTQKAPSS